MAAKPSDAERLKLVLEGFLPPLLTLGPVFMVFGLLNTFAGHILAPGSHLQALIGTAMLSIGLAMLYKKQMRIEARLDELERLKS